MDQLLHDRPTAALSARIPSEHLERLEANAAAHDRSLSAEVRRALRMYLAAIERPSSSPAPGSTAETVAPMSAV